MHLTLLTCAPQPALTDDDQLVADALARHGAEVRVCPWSALDLDDTGDACVLRSTWDYHVVFEQFSAWLDEVVCRGVRLINPPAVVRWNANKSYLQDAAVAGIALPPTVWIDTPDADGVAASLDASGWDRAVIKPCVSASAHGTRIVTPGLRLSEDALAPLRSHGALLQRFLPEIERDGELSLLFFDGAYSHAVRKRPRSGDFRVQHEFGGSEQVVEPTTAERSFAEHALALCPHLPAYARIDLVTTADGPVLMEIELIEPYLYLAHHPDAADRFAWAILAGV